MSTFKDFVLRIVCAHVFVLRYCGAAKSFGPSYPQAIDLRDTTTTNTAAKKEHTVAPALRAMWVVYSVNKEDVGVTRVVGQLPPSP